MPCNCKLFTILVWILISKVIELLKVTLIESIYYLIISICNYSHNYVATYFIRLRRKVQHRVSVGVRKERVLGKRDSVEMQRLTNEQMSDDEDDTTLFDSTVIHHRYCYHRIVSIRKYNICWTVLSFITGKVYLPKLIYHNTIFDINHVLSNLRSTLVLNIVQCKCLGYLISFLFSFFLL